MTVMTEQEIEGWRARLTQIWGVETFDSLPQSEEGFLYRYNFEFPGHPDLVVQILAFADFVAMVTLHTPEVMLLWEDDLLIIDPAIQHPFGRLPLNDPRAAPYLPFFRRGCWLSGIEITSTAHEKAEWMQGIPREEIETWNLSM